MDPTTSASRTCARTDSARRGEWPRFAGVLRAAVTGVRLRPARPRVAAPERERRDRLGHGGRDAQRLDAATVAVAVDIKSGKVTVEHLWSAQDSGFAINPGLIMNQMSGNLVQGASRVLHEELEFDPQACDEPGLGHATDPPLQGDADGHDDRREQTRSRGVRLR